MADTEGQFNYEIKVIDSFGVPLDKFIDGLKRADDAFSALQSTTAGRGGSLREVATSMKEAAQAAKELTKAEKDQVGATKDLKGAHDSLMAERRFEEQVNRRLEASLRRLEVLRRRLSNETSRSARQEQNEQDAATKAAEARAKRQVVLAGQERAAATRDFQQKAAAEARQEALERRNAQLAEQRQERLLRLQQRAREIQANLAERVRRDQERQQQQSLQSSLRSENERRANDERAFRQSVRLLEQQEAAKRAAFAASPEGQANAIRQRAVNRQRTIDVLAQRGFDANGLRQVSLATKVLDGFQAKVIGAVTALGRLATAFLAFRAFQSVGDALAFVQQAVVSFNSKIETSTLGVASLLVAVTEVRDEFGNLVPVSERLPRAMIEARSQVAALRKEALSTAATFEDLSVAFQTALAPGVNAGLTVEQTRKFSVSIARAASALGIASDQLSEEVRSILEGNVTRNSRIAKALDITNADLQRAREAGKLADFLNTKFTSFNQAAQESSKNFDVILSNLKDSFEAVLGEGSIGLFEEVKVLLRDIQSSLVTIKGNEIVVNPEVKETVREIADAFRNALIEIRKTDFSMVEIVGLARSFADGMSIVAKGLRIVLQVSNLIEGGLSRIAGVFSDIFRLIRAVFRDGIANSVDDGVDLALARLEVFKAKFAAIIASLPGNSAGKAIAAAFGVAEAEAAYARLQAAIEGANKEADKTPGLFAQGAESAQKVTDALSKLRDELNAPRTPLGGRNEGSAGTELIRIRQQALREYQDAIQAASDAELRARRERETATDNINVERDGTIKGLAEVALANEKIDKTIQDQEILWRRLNQVIASRQVAQVESQIERAQEESRDRQVEILRAQGKTTEANALELKIKQERIDQEVEVLSRLKRQTDDVREQAIVQERINQLLAERGDIVRLAVLQKEGPTKAGAATVADGAGDLSSDAGRQAGLTFGAQFRDALNETAIVSIQDFVGLATSVVQSFGNLIAQTITDAFNPDADLLENFQNFLQQLASMVLQMLAQIAVAKAVVAAIDLIGGSAGPLSAQIPGGISGINGLAPIARAEGGSVPFGPALASPVHYTARGFSQGGRPAGLPASDTVPAWLTPGEWVMRLAAVRLYGAETMARINEGLVDPMGLRALAADAPRASMAEPSGLGRAAGGPAPSAAVRAAAPVPTYLVADHATARTFFEGGQGAIIDWMRKNRSQIKNAIG